MTDIPQLVAAIDNRLADIAAEIGALDAARAQLVAPCAGAPSPAVTERIGLIALTLDGKAQPFQALDADSFQAESTH